jgi:lipoyl(octanoyl) transferase
MKAAAADVVTRSLGRTDYEATWRAMQAFTSARTGATRDEIWLTEHPPVYTLGLAGRREHLLRDNGIPAIKSTAAGRSRITAPGSSSRTSFSISSAAASAFARWSGRSRRA